MFIEIMQNKSVAINSDCIEAIEKIDDLHCTVVTESGESYKSDFPKNVILNMIFNKSKNRFEASPRP